jgi:hippurate hydrolase
MRRILLATTLAAGALVAAAPALALDVAGEKAAIDAEFKADYPHIDALYKDIHAHPELGHHETRTAALLAKEMKALGFTVTEHVGGTGIVAIYKNGPGPTILVRTELDALPMEEKTGLPYASHVQTEWNGKTTFVDHSCGHDIHMAVWVGTAKALLARKDHWSGTLMFVGQPAEETGDGAIGMIRDGLFTRFPKPDLGFALHGGATADDQVNYKYGVLSSNADSIEIVFHGRGSHGAQPQFSIDPVLMASRFVVDVQSVVSRERDPLQPGIVTIGSFQGGTVGNIIPDTVVLRGTVRSYDSAVRRHMLEGIQRIAAAEAEMAGAPPPDVKVTASGDAVVNDEAITRRTAPVFKAAFGVNAVELKNPITPSEDYSAFIIAGVPSLFFGIGVYDPKRVADAAAGGPPLPSNHSPFYAPVPEPTIHTGVLAMTLAVENAAPK